MCCEARVPAFLLPLLMVYDHEGTNDDFTGGPRADVRGFLFRKDGYLEEERRPRPVEERGRDFEGMVKRWKRNSQTVVAEFKRRRFYQPPSEQRRLAKAKAEKRARRAQMKRERAERRNG
jgi:ribosomal protein S21